MTNEQTQVLLLGYRRQLMEIIADLELNLPEECMVEVETTPAERAFGGDYMRKTYPILSNLYDVYHLIDESIDALEVKENEKTTRRLSF